MMHHDVSKTFIGIVSTLCIFVGSGTVVTKTEAQYPDGSKTGIIYSIFSGNKMQSFGINSITGRLTNGYKILQGNTF